MLGSPAKKCRSPAHGAGLEPETPAPDSGDSFAILLTPTSAGEPHCFFPGPLAILWICHINLPASFRRHVDKTRGKLSHLLLNTSSLVAMVALLGVDVLLCFAESPPRQPVYGSGARALRFEDEIRQSDIAGETLLSVTAFAIIIWNSILEFNAIARIMTVRYQHVVERCWLACR